MVFSSILKNRIRLFFDQLYRYFKVPLALVDERGEVIVLCKAFDEKKLPLPGGKDDHRVKIGNEDFYLIAPQPAPAKAVVTRDLLAISRSVLEALVEGEKEVQSLSDEVIAKYEEINLIYDIINEVIGVFDEKEIGDIILNKAVQVLGIGSGAIVLKEKDERLTILSRLDKNICFGCNDLFYDLARKTIEDKSEVIYDHYRNNSAVTGQADVRLPILSVPIDVGEEVSGAMVLVGRGNGETFRTGDVKLVYALSTYAGVSVNNSRLIRKMHAAEALRHEMALAREIQQSLLPIGRPSISNLDVAGYCIPAAEVGGDFYGYFPLMNGKWAIAVADVSGHGVGAALTMASLRSILRSEARWKPVPAHVVREANELLCADTSETEMYATLFLSFYNETDRTLAYTNAGHVTPFLRKADGNTWHSLTEGGMAIGLFQQEEYDEAYVTLETGDIVLIYTDGLTEEKNTANSFFDEQTILAIVDEHHAESCDEIAQRILDSVMQHIHNNKQRDDITLVVLKSV